MHRLLIVDDEPQIRSLLSTGLRAVGYDVQSAESADEAIRLCSIGSFDLVLSDVMMPHVDGHELARRLAPLCPMTRVMLMTGFDEGCENCPYATRCELIHKPFDLRDLVRMVASALAEAPPRVRP